MIITIAYNQFWYALLVCCCLGAHALRHIQWFYYEFSIALCQAGDHVPFAWVSIKSYQRCQSKSAAVRHEIEEESEHVQGDSGSGRAFPQKLKGLPLLCCKVTNDSLRMIFRDNLTTNFKFCLLLDFGVITQGSVGKRRMIVNYDYWEVKLLMS